MKYNWFWKGLVIFLAVCCLFISLAAAAGIYFCWDMRLYDEGYDAYIQDQKTDIVTNLSYHLAESYASRKLGGISEETAKNYGFVTSIETLSYLYGLKPYQWNYAIYDTEGQLLESRNTLVTFPNVCSFTVNSNHLIYTGATSASVSWVSGPTYQVTIQYSDNAILTVADPYATYVELGEQWCFRLIYILAGSVVLGILCAVYLCLAAGRSAKTEEIRPGGLNRLPLDLYTALAAGICLALAFLLVEIVVPNCVNRSGNLIPAFVILAALALWTGLLVIVLWLYALVAQFKSPNFFWWRNSILGRLLRLVWKLFRKGFGLLRHGFSWVRRGFCALYRLLPVAGKRLLIVAAFLLLFLFALLLGNTGAEVIAVFLLILLSLAFIALFAYDCFCFGTVMKGAKQMANGNLNANISTKYLLGSYKEHAQRLNTMADVATLAARRQMQSERMKAELITNVSHDIKTPLTSLINYVDLLQKPHTEEEGQQYLEVLCRQSQRMKKLLEDLIDMSKASTGNMNVEISRLDGAETVHQALGEFSDKLTAAGLTPVFRQPETPLCLLADGRLTWRVLSNLLSNTVKYALPGTRVYVELTQEGNQALLSLKNISREELNVSAEELTERFVRGDTSRNTEGSGLGLNIAKSLMELQRGQLELTVDGDLFKVTLRFPIA